MYLEEGDRARLTAQSFEVFSPDGIVVQRPIKQASASNEQVSKGSYRHFMAKEIHEQPEAVYASLVGRLGKTGYSVEFLGQIVMRCYEMHRQSKSLLAEPATTPVW